MEKERRYIVVIGSRGYHFPNDVFDYLDIQPEGTVVLTGGARGPDTWAEEWCRLHAVECIVIRPNWTDLDAPGAVVRVRNGYHYNARAGLDRNVRLMDRAKELGAEKVIAFWDGKSSGTKHAFEYAAQIGLDVDIVHETSVNLFFK